EVQRTTPRRCSVGSVYARWSPGLETRNCLLYSPLWYISIRFEPYGQLVVLIITPTDRPTRPHRTVSMDSATKDIGVHWENGEPAILFKSRRKDSARRDELASVTALPSTELPPGTSRLRYADLRQVTDIEPLFAELDDILHRAGSIREARHTILLKLL